MQIVERGKDWKALRRDLQLEGPYAIGKVVSDDSQDKSWERGTPIAVSAFRDHIGINVTSLWYRPFGLLIPKDDVRWCLTDEAIVLQRRSHSGAIVGALMFGAIGALAGSSADRAGNEASVIGIMYRADDDTERVIYIKPVSKHHLKKMQKLFTTALPDAQVVETP